MYGLVNMADELAISFCETVISRKFSRHRMFEKPNCTYMEHCVLSFIISKEYSYTKKLCHNTLVGTQVM